MPIRWQGKAQQGPGDEDQSVRPEATEKAVDEADKAQGDDDRPEANHRWQSTAEQAGPGPADEAIRPEASMRWQANAGQPAAQDEPAVAMTAEEMLQTDAERRRKDR